MRTNLLCQKCLKVFYSASPQIAVRKPCECGGTLVLHERTITR